MTHRAAFFFLAAPFPLFFARAVRVVGEVHGGEVLCALERELLGVVECRVDGLLDGADGQHVLVVLSGPLWHFQFERKHILALVTRVGAVHDVGDFGVDRDRSPAVPARLLPATGHAVSGQLDARDAPLLALLVPLSAAFNLGLLLGGHKTFDHRSLKLKLPRKLTHRLEHVFPLPLELSLQVCNLGLGGLVLRVELFELATFRLSLFLQRAVFFLFGKQCVLLILQRSLPLCFHFFALA
mmetsp:Transcript_8535/g.20565  ORF Transcript_8535/g.20565 Transcript_8535/m.20565 type:complete len:240 (+) Transcript_8535:1237-1956(+)